MHYEKWKEAHLSSHDRGIVFMFFRHIGFGLALFLSLSFLDRPLAKAQRREASDGPEKLELELASNLRFGKTIVSAGKYFLQINETTFDLINPQTMLIEATVPTNKEPLKEFQVKSSIEITIKKNAAMITVLHAHNKYVTAGIITKEKKGRTPDVEQGEKSEKEIKQEIKRHTDKELVREVFTRYIDVVEPCISRARKSRWKTDDPQFIQCLCPLTEKWRLPKVKKALWVHQQIPKKRFGFSLYVNKRGKAQKCRVWAGWKPPKKLN